MDLPARIGKYELQEFLGGGMSHVYRARDTLIGRTVAVKILTDAGCQDTEVKEHFLAEARMAGSLAHDNVLGIYESPPMKTASSRRRGRRRRASPLDAGGAGILRAKSHDTSPRRRGAGGGVAARARLRLMRIGDVPVSMGPDFPKQRGLADIATPTGYRPAAKCRVATPVPKTSQKTWGTSLVPRGFRASNRFSKRYGIQQAVRAA
jgi:hypothetical protein